MIDLFAGCGGLTAGFEEAGYESVLAVECDDDAADTFELNFERKVDRRRIEEIKGFPDADIVVGGPPCQGFSPLNRAGVGFERRGLWREYLRVLEEARPSAFLMENVPPLLRSAEYAAFAHEAEALGYVVDARILNAADFGVPQRRRRAFVIGSRGGPPLWPDLSHYPPEAVPLGGAPWRTFRDAVEGLPLAPDGQNWHRPRNPTDLSLERYRTIPVEGEGRFELAERRPDITPQCWLNHPRGSTDVFGRLWWDQPAFTIRTEFYKPEKGRYLHPSQHRPITVREAARCMSFPDTFRFPEDQTLTSVGRQVGNAVPPLLAERLALTLRTTMASVEASATSRAA